MFEIGQEIKIVIFFLNKNKMSQLKNRVTKIIILLKNRVTKIIIFLKNKRQNVSIKK